MLRPIPLTKSSCLIIETEFSINSRLLFIASLIVASKFDFDSHGLLRKAGTPSEMECLTSSDIIDHIISLSRRSFIGV